MTRYLKSVAGAQWPELEKIINTFEPLTRIGADIALSQHRPRAYESICKLLNLDPSDTTSNELYHALAAFLARQERAIIKGLAGTTETPDAKKIMQSLLHAERVSGVMKPVLTPKRSEIRRIIKTHVPRRTLAFFSCRSVDALLKKHTISSIVFVAGRLEPASWKKLFNQKIDSLAFGQYELRTPETVIVQGKEWDQFRAQLIARNGHPITDVQLSGSILLIVRSGQLKEGELTTLLHGTVKSYAMLRERSSLLRYALFASDKTNPISDIITHPTDKVFPVVYRKTAVTWRRFHYGLTQYPHLSPTVSMGMDAPQTEEDKELPLLIALTGRYATWLAYESLGVVDGRGIVSCNVFDIALNLLYGRPYGSHTTSNLLSTLHRELENRYIGHETVFSLLIDQFEKSFLENKKLMVN